MVRREVCVRVNMSVSGREKVTIELYMQDFEKELRNIDEITFVEHGHPPCTILSYETNPSGGISGARVGMVASFLPKILDESFLGDNVHPFPKTKECYALWQKGVERRLRSREFEGRGDADIRQFWLLASVSLVRSRVWFRRRWFPDVSLRTVRSVWKKHSGIFSTDAFMQLRKLADMFDGRSMSNVEIDMELTRFLVESSIHYGRLVDYRGIPELLVSG